MNGTVIFETKRKEFFKWSMKTWSEDSDAVGFLFNANVDTKKQCTLGLDACGFEHITDAPHDETAEHLLQMHLAFKE